MLEEIYRCKSTIESLRNGPLGDYANELAQYYFDRGYKARHIMARFGPFSQFNKALINNNLCLQDLDHKLIKEFVNQQLETKTSFISSGANLLFKQFINLLIRDGILQPLDDKPTFGSIGINRLLLEYTQYLSREKGLAPFSIKRYSNLALDFVVYSNASTLLKLRKIKAKNIHVYILELGKTYSTKHIQVVATCLRCFLKYLLRKRIINIDLAACVPTLSSYRAVHLPEYLVPNELAELLQSCDQQTATGARNYALLLLLARIGLRASEVINLTLQDINWRCGEFNIKGKGGKKSIMPLPNEVGEALSEYVIHFRPKVNNPYLFLNTRAPFQQFNNPSTVSSIVRRQLYAAGIETTSKGAHLLRYTVATHCLNNGGSLFEACELLRHFSIDTTATYAKVDHGRLSQLAMPWPMSQETSHV